ncbi:unnamed protein product, partial [Rotaria sp. Silwood2]
MEHLVAGLQKLVLMSDHAERIRLLTLCPPTWSRRDISTFFSVPEWEGRMAKELYESSGVLAAYENNQDRVKITPSAIEAVVAYYQEEVNWMKWANLNGKTDIHRLRGSVSDLLMEMDHQWSKFITHSYITNAQFDYIRNLKQSLPPDTALVHMDFAENYTSHGKGPVDGLGAVVKSAARRETMRAGGPEKSFLTPEEFYKFLKQKFCSKPKNPTPNTSDVTTVDIIDAEKIQIWYLSETDINQHFDKYLSQRSETRPSTGPIF